MTLIEHVSILPKLFETVFVPEVVRAELSHTETPPLVRQWFATAPTWLAVLPDPAGSEIGMQALDGGERGAIMLAMLLDADLILMDDRAGVSVARTKKFAVIGTLGLLDLAARRGLLDLEAAFARLKSTNFRCRPELLDAVLAQHRMRG